MRFKIGDAIIDKACREYGTGVIVELLKGDWDYRINFEFRSDRILRQDNDNDLEIDLVYNSPLLQALK